MVTQNSGSAPSTPLRALSSLILGIGLIVWAVHGGAPQAASEGPSTVVLVATRSLIGGTTLSAADVREQPVAADLAAMEPLSHPADAIGKRLTVTLATNEMVTRAELQGASASSNTGHRLITLQTEGRLLPPGLGEGDEIDVVAGAQGGAASTVVGSGRVIAVSKDQTTDQLSVVTVETSAAEAIAIAGLPAGSPVRLIESAP